MTLLVVTYAEKPKEIEVVEVHLDNLSEVLNWCNGHALTTVYRNGTSEVTFTVTGSRDLTYWFGLSDDEEIQYMERNEHGVYHKVVSKVLEKNWHTLEVNEYNIPEPEEPNVS